MENLFLATSWAKLLMITVNFENKTKVFISDYFGWLVTVKHKHLAHTCTPAL